MTKILTATHGHIMYVEEKDNEYIRFESGSWIRAYSNSWECCWDMEEELEKAYQEFTLKQIPR